MEVQLIRQRFAEWQALQLRERRFWAKDSCSGRWFAEHDFVGELSDMWGLPDSTGFRFSYADLNNDQQLDGLVTFVPEQCDGGNGSIWTQVQVFVLSGARGYTATDSLRVETFARTRFDSAGFYWLDSITTNTIHGTYLEFRPDDGHCCPSVTLPVRFNFTKRRLAYLNNKRIK